MGNIKGVQTMWQTNSKTFSDLYPSFENFKADLNLYGYKFTLTEDELKLIFIMLVTKYGDSEIISFRNEYRWKMKLQYIIFTYGKEWALKKQIQEQILNLTDEDLLNSSIQITNRADNPATEPSTKELEELKYINSQVAQGTKRDKLSILILKYSSIMSQANESFIDRFQELFSKFPLGDKPIWYYRNEE